MFPSRYFGDRYWAPRYWPKVGQDTAIHPGLQFSQPHDRLDFTAEKRIHDLTGEPSTLDFTAENT